ncbi:MAG: DUF3782 domain-containing protein [Beggiatoa sp. IS2]|nr:MAG: DUF3782 domain-containing protein [Beggiatoa sp. IS2]
MTYEQVLELISKLSQEVRELRSAQQETDKQIQETDKQLRSAQQETDKQIQKTGKQIKELATQIGGLGNKFGRFAEGLAFPSMEKILRQRFGLETISLRVKRQKAQGEELELDILAYRNGDNKAVFVVEVKSHLQSRELTQILKTLTKFPEFFPEHNDKKLYGMVAVVDANKEMRQKVIEAGLYLALIHDEQFDLQVPDDFQPQCFHQPEVLST